MHWTKWIEKFFYVIVAFALAIYFITLFKAWGESQRSYFLFVGNVESAVLVLGITIVFTIIIEKLLKWEIRTLFGSRKGARK